MYKILDLNSPKRILCNYVISFLQCHFAFHNGYLKLIDNMHFFNIYRFEAKPVETNDDQRVYETFDGDSDFDDDNENYCRYLLPQDDPSGATEDGKFPYKNEFYQLLLPSQFIFTI